VKALAGLRAISSRGELVGVFYARTSNGHLWSGAIVAGRSTPTPRLPHDDYNHPLGDYRHQRALGIPIPAGPARWRTFLFPMSDCPRELRTAALVARDLFSAAR
jgi:hypothetical protein